MSKDGLPTALTDLLELSQQLYFERRMLMDSVNESDAHWQEKYNRRFCSPRRRGRTHVMFERLNVRGRVARLLRQPGSEGRAPVDKNSAGAIR